MNLVYLMVSQIIGLSLGILKSILLPIYLTVEDFGYWQIYLLYVGYLGMLSLGFNDGLLARYGKLNFDSLPTKKIGESIKVFMFFNLILTSLFLSYLYFYVEDEKKIVFYFVVINIPITILNGIFLFLLQSTNQIKKYSLYSIIDKSVLLFTILIILFFNSKNIYIIIVVDILSKLIQALLMYLNFKVLFSWKLSLTKSIFTEIIDNIKRGFFILLTNLVGMLLFGYGMFLIERFMSLSEYSNYSLSISTTNILLLFINAMAIVTFPYLSRINKDQLNNTILNIYRIVFYVSLIMIVAYFPIEFVIKNYLNEYKKVLSFLPYVFLAVVIQLKYNILLLPIAKLKKVESKLFKINLSLLLLNIVLTTLSVSIFNSISLVAISLFITMLIRNLITEKTILNNINHSNSMIFTEILYYLIFLLAVFNLKFLTASVIYIVFLVILFAYNYHTILDLLRKRSVK